MKKKLISIVLSVAMLLSLAATNALADAVSWWKTPNSYGAATVTDNVTFEGEVCHKITPTAGHIISLSFEYLGISLAANPYLIVEYYYDEPQDLSANTSVVALRLDCLSGGWTWPEPFDNLDNRLLTTELKKGQWTRAVFDCREFAAVIGDSLVTQVTLGPWANEDGWVATSEGQYFYIKSAYCTNLMPSDYIAKVQRDENNKAYAYVSEKGYVTVGGENIGAYQTVKAAFEALGSEEATVYISGEVKKFDDVTGRGKVLVRGLGDTEADIAGNKLSGTWRITGGDITFDYLTMIGSIENEGNSLYSTGSTIVIGENVISDVMFAGLGNGAAVEKPRKMIFNGGEWGSVAAGTNWSGNPNGEYCSAVEYIFNGGKFYSVYGGSKEAWEWANTDVGGDVSYTFNGGDYYGEMYLGSDEAPNTVYGNITWTVNGGYMEGRRIVGGHKQNRTVPSWGGIGEGYSLHNTAVVVNNGNIGNGDSISTLTLGTAGAALGVGGKEIYILNNYEKNTLTKIDPASTAQYRMHVYNGSAVPVYDKSLEDYGGDLLGFALTADKTGAVPYLNGVALEAVNGIYTIPENTTAGEITKIVFAAEGECVAALDTSDSAVTAKVYNFAGEKKMMLVVGKYDGTTLEYAYMTEKVVDGIDELTVDDFTKEAGKTYRAFIWDSDMKPYLPDRSF